MTQENIAQDFDEKIDLLLSEIRPLAEQDERETLKNRIATEHPADLAAALDRMESEPRRLTFSVLKTELAADVLSECEEDIREDLMEAISEDNLGRILENMDLDDAADAVAELPEDKALRVLQKMSEEDSEDIRDLLQYTEDTAGGIMTPEVLAFPESTTVGEVLEAFRGTWESKRDAERRDTERRAGIKQTYLENAYELIQEEHVYTIYVVDKQSKLVGFVRLQDLLRSVPQTRLASIVETDLISVQTDVDQEEVARIARRYDMPSIPVVDLAGRLVGRVTIDDLMDVIAEETTEDFMKMAGTTEDEMITWSPVRSSILRFPWLMAAMVGLLVSSVVISRFEMILSRKVQLVFFTPVVCGLSGNTGVQAATIMVRGLATGQIDIGSYMVLFWKELRAGLMLGAIYGVLLSGVVTVFTGDIQMGYIISLSIFLAMTWANIFGMTVPALLEWMKKDPAIATGPIVTSGIDALAAAIYLLTATLLIG